MINQTNILVFQKPLLYTTLSLHLHSRKMKAIINTKLIPQLKPNDKQYDVRDNKLKGFLIRVHPSGKMSYVCEYARGKRINIGPVGILTPTQARDRAREILSDVMRGINPKTIKSNHTVASFLKKHYEPWAETHLKRGQETVNRIKRCFALALGEKSISDITPLMIEHWRTKRLDLGRNPVTVNTDLRALKAMLSKAVQWGVIDTHPIAGLKLLKTDSPSHVRYLTKEEEHQLRIALDTRGEELRTKRKRMNAWLKERNYPLLPDLRALSFVDHLKPMILVSLNTGIRRGALFELRWKDVNFAEALLTVRGQIAKSGKTRHIPLNREALETLAAWQKQVPSEEENLVFASENGKPFNTIKTAWGSFLKKANIKNFRWHDMRHHFASRLVMASVDLNTVRELLGHADIQMTLRYAHLAPAHKAEAVAKLLDDDSR